MSDIPSRPFRIEVCVENGDGLVAAQQGGVDRAELCAALLEGGLTPSWGMIREALRVATIPFHVIVRPRGGDFVYSEIEFAAMLDDVRALAELGVAGVVIGCLTADGDIDEPRMTALVDASGPLSVTCHRAFDMTRDYRAALEALVRCGVDRVLTSGQRDSAEAGFETLTDIVARASGRIGIMVCGQLDEDNIADIRRRVRPDEMHFAAGRAVASAMTWRNPDIGMGGTAPEREYLNTVTDPERVRSIAAAARAAL